MDFKDYITVIEDYPEKGIRFKDITTLMQDGPVYRQAIDHMIEFAGKHDVDVIVGPEARGFVVGCPVAYAMEKAFVPIRKEGKLPRETITEDYGLEYGEASLSIHTDAIKPGQRVLITDDLLATGGTVRATVQLVEKLGGIVAGLAFFIELSYLDARNNKDLNGYNVYSLVTFD